MTMVHRDQAIDVIHTTSQMFKNVSHEQETTAALQADFLQSLVAHQHQRPMVARSVSDWPPNEGDCNGLDLGSGSVYQADPSPNHGPLIDVTDFESWLSSFELGTLADPQIDSRSWSGIAMQDVPTVDNSTLTAQSTDWDAVSALARV
jgi:hypothetical protein